MDLGKLVRNLAVGMALGVSSMYGLSCGTKPAGETEPCTQESGCSYGRECVDNECVGGEGDDDSYFISERIAFLLSNDEHAEEIYLIKPFNGSVPQRLTFFGSRMNGGAGVNSYDWSSNKGQIAVTAQPQENYTSVLYTVDINSGIATILKDSTFWYRDATWSHDGTFIVCVGGYTGPPSDGVSDILLTIRSDGNEEKTLIDQGFVRISSPTWSTSDDRVAFIGVPENEENLGEVYVVRSNGYDLQKITQSGNYIRPLSLQWSSNEEELLLEGDDIIGDSRRNIYSVILGNLIPILIAQNAEKPALSSDSLLVFMCNSGYSDICITSLGSSTINNVTQSEGISEISPTWSHNQQQIGYGVRPNILMQNISSGHKTQLTVFSDSNWEIDNIKWSP